MRVGNSMSLLSNDVSAGLILNQEDIDGNVEPTAWFCRYTFRWFKLMTSRSPGLALSYKNMEEYNEATSFLQEYLLITKELKFNPKRNALMPFQKGIIISTTSVLELHEYLLNLGFEFTLTARYSTDCCENLFSQVRVTNRKPSAKQFKMILRLLTVSNYLANIETSNYQFDEIEDSFSMLDFLESNVNSDKADNQGSSNMEKFNNFKMQRDGLSKIEKNHVFYAAGYILRKISKIKQFSSCKKCMNEIACEPRGKANKFSQLTQLKNYKKKKDLLHFPKDAVFKYFIKMEQVIKSLKNQNLFGEKDCLHFFQSLMAKGKFDSFKDCHSVKEKMCFLYFKHRLRISLRQVNRNKEANQKHIY